MKKLYKFLVLVFVLSAVAFCIETTEGDVFAAVSESECDNVFVSTINELFESDSFGDITATKEIIYDINLELLGYLYNFSSNKNSGFAIIIKSGAVYECTEIYYDAINPYDGLLSDEKCIYINTMIYWLYSNGIYCDSKTKMEIPSYIVEEARKKAYYASDVFFTVNLESINFLHRSEDKFALANRHPQISMSTEKTSCVPIMGANIIQFYDKFCTNLIANYTPGISIGNIYRYKLESIDTAEVVNKLAVDMGCGTGGATQLQFANGMEKYCRDRGYNFSYTICMNNGQFNYNFAKTQLTQGKPIALFLDVFSIENMNLSEQNEIVEHRFSLITHAMAVFGYKDITYTITDGETRSDSYLQVSTGIQGFSFGYCKVNSFATIDQALAINIH